MIGKYGQDFGIVEESCFPYIAKDSPCGIPKKCGRIYTAEYSYVGGFYGGCSEMAMMLELVKNGPMAVAFEVWQLSVPWLTFLLVSCASCVRFPSSPSSHRSILTS